MQNLDPLAIWVLVIFGAFVPYISIASAGKLRWGTVKIPPRKKIYVQTLVLEGLFLAIALFAVKQRDLAILGRGTLTLPAVITAVAILGWSLAVFASLMAFGLHVVVRLAGSHYLAMAVHFLQDFAADFVYIRLAKELPRAAQSATAVGGGQQPA